MKSDNKCGVWGKLRGRQLLSGNVVFYMGRKCIVQRASRDDIPEGFVPLGLGDSNKLLRVPKGKIQRNRG